MEQPRSRQHLSRIGIFAVVVIAHVVVLSLRVRPPSIHTKEPAALTLIDLDPRPVRPPAQRAPPQPNAALAPDPVLAPPPTPAIEPDASAISTPPVDWRANIDAAARAAAEKAIREEGYRALGSTEHRGDETSPSESPFQQPRHKGGEIEHDPAAGRTLVWHNSRCYTELKFPVIKDPNAIVGAPNPPKCGGSIGKPAAQGDLFDHMKRR